MHPTPNARPFSSLIADVRTGKLLKVSRTLVFIIVLLYGIMLGALIPPLQSPDEAAHITQAAVISHGSLFGKSVDNTIPGGQMDVQLRPFFDHYNQLRGNPNKLTGDMQASGNAMTYSGKTEFAATPATAYYLPIVYFPQAMGLALGRWTNLSLTTSTQLARAFALLASLAILFFAIRLYPPNIFVLSVLLMPMVLFQVACSGIDGITTAAAVFALGYFMRSTDKLWCPPALLEFAFALALLVLCTTRQHLTPMLLLPFWLYFMRRETKLLAIGSVLFILTLAWTVYVTNVTSGAAPSVIPTLQHYLRSPSAALAIIYATIFNGANLYNYVAAFIGILGWIDTPMQSWFYKIAGAFAIVAAGLSFSLKSSNADWSTRCFLLALSLVSSALVFIIMMIVWTKLPASQIEGVQGRYFFVPALMFGYALSGAKIDLQYRQLKLGLLCCFALLASANTAYVVFDRYYVVPQVAHLHQR